MGRFAHLTEQMGDIQRLAWEEVWMYAEDCSDVIWHMPQHRRVRVASALVAELLEAQEGICPLCETSINQAALGAFHVDYVIPFTYGGGYERENLQLTHPVLQSI